MSIGTPPFPVTLNSFQGPARFGLRACGGGMLKRVQHDGNSE